jgi:hypothetical protein
MFYIHGHEYAYSLPESVVTLTAPDTSTRRALTGRVVSSVPFTRTAFAPVTQIEINWSDEASATRCLFDHLSSLFATGSPFYLQADAWLGYVDGALYPTDVPTEWLAPHSSIYPAEFSPTSQDATWADCLEVIAEDGSSTILDVADFSVDSTTGLVTLDTAPAAGSYLRLSYQYVPYCTLLDLDMMANPESTLDEGGYETYVYTGKAVLQVIPSNPQVAIPAPTWHGCLERFLDTDFSDLEVPLPEDDIIPPYPEPEVVIRDCYPANSKFSTIKSSTYTTSSLAPDIPLGNVIAGVEFYSIYGFIWSRQANDTYTLTGRYALTQAASPVHRDYVKSAQFPGVYDNARQGFVDATSSEIMGQYYDDNWPVLFGRASEAQHQGTITGYIRHTATPDASPSFPLSAQGTTYQGTGTVRNVTAGVEGSTTYTDPYYTVTTTKTSADGIYELDMRLTWNKYPGTDPLPAEE